VTAKADRQLSADFQFGVQIAALSTLFEQTENLNKRAISFSIRICSRFVNTHTF
jgi:hypothetical protein